MNEKAITYRHAILFEGSPISDPLHEATAKELLTEWGVARGLKPIGYATQQRDYRLGHALEFSGEITAPTQRTRLQGAGRKFPDELLTGFEERVPWPLPEGWRAPQAEESDGLQVTDIMAPGNFPVLGEESVE